MPNSQTQSPKLVIALSLHIYIYIDDNCSYGQN